MKKLKNPVDSIAKATLQLLIAQQANNCIPDYIIHQVCLNTGVVDKEARHIRDLIQSDFRNLWSK